MTAPDHMREDVKGRLHEPGHPHMEPPANRGRFSHLRSHQFKNRLASKDNLQLNVLGIADRSSNFYQSELCESSGGRVALISIIIPAFNAQATIADAVKSALGASRQNRIEVIVVDDASSDHTAETVRRMIVRDVGKVTLLRSPSNVGAGACRNIGMGAASGDWLMFLDADDFALPGALDAPLERLGSTVVDFVVFPYHYVTGARSHRKSGMLPEDERLWRDVFGVAGRDPIEARQIGRLVSMTNYPWNKLIHRNFAEKISLRFTEVPVNNDIAAHWQLFSHAGRILLHDEATVFHFVNKSNAQITNVFDVRRLAVFSALEDARSHLFRDEKSIDTYYHHFVNFEVKLLRWIFKRLPPEMHEEFFRLVKLEFSSIGESALRLLSRKVPNVAILCVKLGFEPAANLSSTGRSL